MMKLVNESNASERLEESGGNEVAEVGLWKRDQMALLVSQRGREERFSVASD